MSKKSFQIQLMHGVVDLRKGESGLLSLLPEAEEGVQYLFSNRSRTLIKSISLDNHGYWTYTRRLKSGSFRWLEAAKVITKLTADQYEELCNGHRIAYTYKDYT